jgi:outer membrane cobalamin receptor
MHGSLSLLVGLLVVLSSLAVSAGAAPLDSIDSAVPDLALDDGSAANEAVSEGSSVPADDSTVSPVDREPSAEATEETPEIAVEVVGKREGLLSITPAPGEVITEVDSQEIYDSGAEYVLDAVDLTPSVFIRSQGARYENRLSIRGAAPRLVLLDGIPIAREGYTGLGGGAGGAEAGFAGRILYTLPADIIERIDIIRSVGTIVYGPTAGTGAVINIVTKDPKEGEDLSASAAYGSYSREKAHVLAEVSDGRISYLAEGGSEYAQSNLPFGEKRFANTFSKIIYDQPDGSRLFIDYFSLDGHRTIDLSQDFSIVPPRYWTIDPWKERFANVVYSKALEEDATLDVAYYQRDRDFTTDLFTNDTFTTVKQNWLESEDDHGFDLRYSLRHDSGRMTRAGYQWAKTDSDTLLTTYIGSSGPLPRPKVTPTSLDRTTNSLFYQETLPLRPDLRFDIGARYDDVSGYSGAMTYAAGVQSDLSPKTTWHGHIGTGREHPTPTAGDIDAGIVPPEAKTLSAETGLSVRTDGRSNLALNLFWTKTEDAQILYNSPPGEIGPLAWLSKPEDLTQWGLETIYSQRISDNLHWFVNYTFLRESVTNEHEPYVPGLEYPTIAKPPKHIAAGGLRATINGTKVNLSAKYSSDYMAINRLMRTAAPVDSYLVFDLQLGRQIGGGDISLYIDNLLDTDYETMPAFPQPGRSYLVRYSQHF